MHAIIVSVALAVMLATSAVAQSGDAKGVLVKVTRDWLNAEESGDRGTLHRIIADDFLGTGPGGNRVTKDMILPAPGSERKGISIEPKDVEANLWGDTGVVIGHGRSRSARPGSCGSR